MTEKEENLKKLKASLNSPTTPDNFKEKLKKAIDVIEKEIEEDKKAGSKKEPAAKPKPAKTSSASKNDKHDARMDAIMDKISLDQRAEARKEWNKPENRGKDWYDFLENYANNLNSKEESLKELVSALKESYKKPFSELSDSEKELVRDREKRLTNYLFNKESDVWDEMKVSSGSEIRNSDSKLQKYAELCKEFLDGINISKGFVSSRVYDELVNDNAHLFVQFLHANGYLSKDVDTSYNYGNGPHETKMLTIGKKESETKKTAPSKVSATYTARHEIESVTIEEDGEQVTYKISDFLDGLHQYKKGGRLADDNEYIPKRDIVSINLKSGRSMKPSNGVWLNKQAVPIDEPKFKRGGRLKSALMRDRKYVNKSQDYEVKYSKGKNRPSYLEKGGRLDKKTVEALFSKAKKEIINDVKKGVLPRSIKSFEDLNDYVDANEYGGFTDEEYELSEDFEIENAVQNKINDWLKSSDFKKEIASIPAKKEKHPNRTGNVLFVKAKEIRENGEDWQAALARARKLIAEEN